jgi:molybdenum cofactor cytidylyltransferase
MVEVAALILAAGRATRFGAGEADSKLTALLEGKALVRHVVEAALASHARPVIVGTGHARAGVEAALSGLGVQLVHNPDFAKGMSTSLKAGLASLPASSKGALVMLGDMPRVTAAVVDQLIDCFERENAQAVVPVFGSARGNPVLIGRALFGVLAVLSGDQGARRVLEAAGTRVAECAVTDASVLADVDTREALADLIKKPRSAD